MNDFDVSITDAAGGYHQWPRDQVKVEIEDKLERTPRPAAQIYGRRYP